MIARLEQLHDEFQKSARSKPNPSRDLPLLPEDERAVLMSGCRFSQLREEILGEEDDPLPQRFGLFGSALDLASEIFHPLQKPKGALMVIGHHLPRPLTLRSRMIAAAPARRSQFFLIHSRTGARSSEVSEGGGHGSL